MPNDRRGRYAPRPRFDHGRPFATLGLAPFAGVLLTLTLLFAALRPPVIHALLVDLPFPMPDEIGPRSPAANRLSIAADGSLRWNSHPIDERELRTILAHTKRESPQPALLFAPAGGASYFRALETMELIRREGLIDYCFRFADIDRHRRYEAPAEMPVSQVAQAAHCHPALVIL